MGAETSHRPAPALRQRITDSVKQMGFPHPAGADDDQRVVAPGRLGHDGPGGLECHSVARGLEEIIDPPDRERRGWRMSSLTGPLSYRLGPGEIVGVAE